MIKPPRSLVRSINRAAARIARACFDSKTSAYFDAWVEARDILDTQAARGVIAQDWIDRAELREFENLLVQLSATRLSQLMR